jgi:hypothetical protein
MTGFVPVCVCVLAFGGLLLINSTTGADIRLPPSILVGPSTYNIFRPDDVIVMECRATGIPKPKYTWTKNDVQLNENVEKIRRLSDEGTIEIRDASVLDVGIYRCYAENQFGTAVSVASQQERAILPTDGAKAVQPVTVREGQPFAIERVKDRCFPRPSFEWQVAMQLDTTPVKLTTNQRIQIDGETGDLHFAYAMREDQLSSDKVYKCSVINPYLDISAGGSYTNVTVIPEHGGPQEFQPRIGFSTASPFVALKGHNVTLRCFYYGNPTPSIIWRKLGGQLPVGRHIKQNFNSELTITNVEQSDEGEYVCTGSNKLEKSDTTIRLDVQAAPEFRQKSDLPRNLNLTDGDSVTLYCGADAEPEANIVWMQNKNPLDPNNLPSKFRLTNDNQNLTIKNVCKNCGNDESDLQVIHCNASNKHGYKLAAGYINVLLRTELVNSSDVEETVSDSDEKRFQFDCKATSDDSTPVTLRWYHVPRDAEDPTDEIEVRNIDILIVGHNNNNNETSRTPAKRWIISDASDGSSLVLQLAANDSEGWRTYGGVYRCKATNGYSTATRQFTIHVDNVRVTPDNLKGAGATEFWWIFLLIAIIFLLFAVVTVFATYLQRNRGESYPVDEKERANGNNPEKEILDSEFQNYNRSSEILTKGSRSGSLGSLMNVDDVSSVDEYGDVDAGRYTEDGSFVGAYTATNTVDRAKNRGRSGSRTNI